MKCRNLLAFAACVTLAVSPVRADEVADLKAQLQALQQQMTVLQTQLQKVTEEVRKREEAKSASPAPDEKASAVATEEQEPRVAEQRHGFFERKPGNGLTFYTPGGEITLYGKIDVSLDAATKGTAGMIGPDGNPPVGRMGWMPDISTNMSYFGVRGFQTIKDLSVSELPLSFVYQLETQFDISAMPGTSQTNSNESDVVKGALISRDSFVGLSTPNLGSIKIGKEFAPYRASTDRLNPFSGMIGDYQVVMGNTGGDNRVEFGTRLDHSIWYESPNLKGVVFNALFSPGQNRSSDSDNIAAGESDCTGGNIPGSGGIIPQTCSDGSFSDAVSASVSYSNGSVYLTTAYERHMKVNRSSDITGIYASNNAFSQRLQAEDVADEDAAKIAAQYIFPTKTMVGGIFETLHRYVPADLEFQNERQRLGTWLVLSQQLNRTTSLHFGWAHAFRTPGDPGQHNDSYNTPPGGVAGTDFTAGAHANNTANMFTVALKHQLSGNLTAYMDWAMTANGLAAHYDLGAGGRGITTDCHDASGAAGGLVASNPHCWTGSTLMGASLGMIWKF